MSTKFLSPGWRMPRNANQSKQSNYSMDFDGTQVVSQGAGNFTSFNGVSECSVSLWFKSTTSQGPGKWFFNVPATTTGNHGFGVYASGTGLTSHVYTSSLVEVVTNFSGNQWDGNWHHLVLTYKDGIGLRFYYDSVLQFTNNTMSGTITAGGEELAIGSFSQSAPTAGVISKIDGVSAFNYALSSSQVTTLYGSSSTGIGNPMSLSPKPVAYYPLGDQDAFNGADYLVPNSSLKDYVFSFPSSGMNNIKLGSSGVNIGQQNTISIWVNFNGTPPAPYGDDLLISTYAGNWMINPNISQNYLCYGATDGTGGPTTYECIGGLTYPTGWFLLTVVRNNTNFSLYFNDQLQGSGSESNFTSDTVVGMIGSTDSGNQLTHDVSNLTLFNTALSATDVATLYNYGSPIQTLASIPQSSNLKAWYKLDANEIYDSSNTQWQIANNVLSDKAYSFNGTNNIEITQNSSIQTSNFSIGLWIKGYPQSGKTIIENGGTHGFSIKTDLTDTAAVRIITGGTNGLKITGALNGEWNFVWFTWNGGNSRGGLNGGYNYSGGGATNYDSSKGLFIGSDSSSSNGFVGEIAQVVYYDGRGNNNATGTYGTVPTNPPASTSSTANLVSWWKLDAASITDSQGSNNGTSNGATLIDTNVGRPAGIGGLSLGLTQSALEQSDLSFTSGYSPYALDFDGADDYVSAGRVLGAENTSTLSVSFWLKIPSTGAKSYLGYFIGSFGAGWLVEADAHSIYFAIGDTGTGYQSFTLPYSGNININTWYHICMVYDGNETGSANILKVYINGTQKTLIGSPSFPASIPTLDATAEFTIGGIKPSAVSGQKTTSNVSVFNSALTSSQVREIYNEGVPSNLNNHSAYSNLVSWWQLGSNTSWVDPYWIALDEKGTNNGQSQNIAAPNNMGENAIVDGVGSYANGLSSGMGGDEIIGDASYSTANALSVNMDVLDRVTDTPS